MIRFILVSALFFGEVLASSKGEAHHASITDLIWPAFNLIVLTSFILWKIKNPLRDYFEAKARNVAESYDRAQFKHKDALSKYENFKGKIDRVEEEKEKIIQEAQLESEQFKNNLSKETELRAQKMHEDALIQLEQEKASMVGGLEDALIDQVLIQTRKAINDGSDFKNKIAKKLLSQVH